MHWHIVEGKEIGRNVQNIYVERFTDYTKGVEAVKDKYRNRWPEYRKRKMSCWLIQCDNQEADCTVQEKITVEF